MMTCCKPTNQPTNQRSRYVEKCFCLNFGRVVQVCMYMYNKVSKVGDHSRGWPEGSLFDSLLHQGVGEGATPFPGLLHFTLDPYLIMPSVKQGGIKYHFLSLWYDSTWDWTQVSRSIGEHWVFACSKITLIWNVTGIVFLYGYWPDYGLEYIQCEIDLWGQMG